MPITYVVDHPRNIIVETWRGAIGADDLASYWRDYLADLDVMNCRRTLVDLRDARISFTGSELSTLVREVVLPALRGRRWATAILVAAPEQYGTSRQYQVFAECYSTDFIFSDWDDAERWLVQQNPDWTPPPNTR